MTRRHLTPVDPGPGSQLARVLIVDWRALGTRRMGGVLGKGRQPCTSPASPPSPPHLGRKGRRTPETVSTLLLPSCAQQLRARVVPGLSQSHNEQRVVELRGSGLSDAGSQDVGSVPGPLRREWTHLLLWTMGLCRETTDMGPELRRHGWLSLLLSPS